MPNRILREGILTSERVAALNWAEEVFYRRLMSVVDDFGRYHANPKLLRAALYPLLIDKVSDADIGKWLTSCVNAALVSVYPAPDGKRYLQLLDFRQQARADKSKFPPMPSECAADATQLQSEGIAHAPVVEGVVVDEDEGVTARPRATPSKRKTSIPEDFSVSDAVRAWAVEKGFGMLGEHLEAFARKAKAKDYRYVDWDLAFMEAIREDWAKLRGRGPNGSAPAGESMTTATKAVGMTQAALADGIAREAAIKAMTPEQRRASREAAIAKAKEAA